MMIGNDMILSILIGGVLSIIIIIISSSTKSSGNNNESKISDSIEVINNKVPLINEPIFKEKSKRIQEMFGLSEEQIHNALQETNNSLKIEKINAQPEDEVSWFSILDSAIFVSLICFSLYFINVVSHGDFGRMLLALFPKEFESLKMTEYIRKYHIK
jgi:hypothetical protein